MQLEFDSSALISRLDKMKSVLAKGNTGNHKKMDSMMGSSLANQKEKHKNQLAENMIKLYNANKLVEEKKAEREGLHQRFEEQQKLQAANVNGGAAAAQGQPSQPKVVKLESAMKGFSDHRKFAKESKDSDKQLKNHKAAANEPQIEEEVKGGAAR